MKYLIIFLVLCSFFSCDLGYMLQDHYEADIEGYMIDNGIDSRDKILRWVADNITYKNDNPEEFFKYDDWQTPEETFVKKTGDCEDFSILFMYMLDIIGIESTFVIVNRKNPHAMVLIDSAFFDPQNGFAYFSVDSIMETKTLDEVLYIAEYALFRNVQ